MYCPVCKALLKRKYTDTIGSVIISSLDECTRCRRYRYEFDTGSHRVSFRDLLNEWQVWTWYYTENEQVVEQIHKEVEEATQEAANVHDSGASDT